MGKSGSIWPKFEVFGHFLEFDALVLPGGEPGTTNLENDPRVKSVIDRFDKQGKWIGAICAAPRILNRLGYLSSRKATSYPTEKEKMDDLFRIGNMSWFGCEFSYDVQEFEAFGLDEYYIQLVFNDENSWAYA